MAMDGTSIASIIVAVIAMGSALASQRAASRASVLNTTTTSRVDMERDAYVRARTLDTETIRRLEKENADLRKEQAESRRVEAELRKQLNEVQQELYRMRRALTRLNIPIPEAINDPAARQEQEPAPDG